MRSGKLLLLTSVACGSVLPAAAASRTRHSSSSHRPTKAAPVHAKATGPRAIDDGRATEIQQALVKAGYLSGEPSGHWDASSHDAMQRLQADNGWQTKLVPDSRALIKLGLGPGASGASTP